MSKKRNRRPQASKSNRDMTYAFRELRKGSHTAPLRSSSSYKRKPKYPIQAFKES